MKKVFLSSVAVGLEAFRDAAYKAINGLDGYHCVRMEDFGARTTSPRDFCTTAVRSCDIFVGIIGQRYGNCAPDSAFSFTELEYLAAEEVRMPRLMSVAPDNLPVPANQRESDELHAKLAAFRRAVLSTNTAAFFESEESLALAVVTALQNERLAAESELLTEAAAVELGATTKSAASRIDLVTHAKTYLLFPFVSNVPTANGNFDTLIAIPNTGLDPLGTVGRKGACTVHYYGTQPDATTPLSPQTSAIVEPGETLFYVLSSGSRWGLDGRARGFTGYLIVECDFPLAHGFAHIHPQGANALTGGVRTSYLATQIAPGRISG